MSGPIIRQYGVPNWDEIFGGKDSKGADAQGQQSDGNEKVKEQPPADRNDESEKATATPG